MNDKLTPELLLNAYAQGIFPMSESADDSGFYWVRPQKRGIIPLDDFHISRSLAKRINQHPFDIRIDTDFIGVIEGCAESKQGRETTWINDIIRTAYQELYKLGFCHTIEAWQDNNLMGGLYGISINGAFFGESMFSRAKDASKICLANLVFHLKKQNFLLLDTQFITEHLRRFGAIEILRKDYEKLLNDALKINTGF